jgi:hypothetical protein
MAVMGGGPFERRLHAMKDQLGIDDPHTQSAIFVHDTMETAQAIALDLFGGSVPPETVLKIYDKLVEREEQSEDEEEDEDECEDE